MYRFTNSFTTLIGKLTLSRWWRQLNGHISTSGYKSDVTIASSVWTVKRFEMHHRAKFRQNRLNRSRDMAILDFFKMAAAAIFDFWNFKFLTVGTLSRVELHNHAKFRRNCSNHGWDMAIFRFSRWRPPPSWICNACVGTIHEGHLVVFITVQNLAGIDAVVLIVCTFFDFASLAWKRLFTPQNWGVLTP